MSVNGIHMDEGSQAGQGRRHTGEQPVPSGDVSIKLTPRSMLIAVVVLLGGGGGGLAALLGLPGESAPPQDSARMQRIEDAMQRYGEAQVQTRTQVEQIREEQREMRGDIKALLQRVPERRPR